MSEQYALLFILEFSNRLAPTVDNLENLPYDIRKIFYYLNMCVCILDNADLMKGTFTSEDISNALADENVTKRDKDLLEALANKTLLTQQDLSTVKTITVIKPIIRSIFPDLKDTDGFRWMLTSLGELKWPKNKPTTKAELVFPQEGASGGISR
jgi:hypothetical protein